MPEPMDCFGLTDRGRVRKSNEDEFLIADLNKSMLVHQTSLDQADHSRLFGSSLGNLLVVADGMGGHAGGQRAASIAVASVTQYILNAMPWFLRLLDNSQGDDWLEELKVAVERCQKVIEDEAAHDAELEGMGTTLTMAYIVGRRLYVVHAGDSRCYLVREGRLEQVTKDHTMAQQLVDSGALTPDEAQGSRYSHVLWNCVGGGTPDLKPEVYKSILSPGDTVLLCTDGLSKVLRDHDLSAILARSPSAEAAARGLIDEANERGGPDNVTVIVARIPRG